MTDEEAKAVAGDLYGKILLRNADKPGYSYVLEQLKRGTSPFNLLMEFVGSEEFREKFLLNDTPNEISRKTYRVVNGRDPTSHEIRIGAHVILEAGYRNFVSALLKGKSAAQRPLYLPDFGNYQS